MVDTIASGVCKSTLPNGITLLIKENNSSAVVAVLVRVGAGYFHEPDHWNGLSHVIEHMFFKGTSRRPGKEQIAAEVRAIGGSINASTYYDETNYHIVVPSEHLEEALDILADALANSLFDPNELTRELEVIIQESLQKRDNPSAMLIETLYARAYDKHRIRRWRIGQEETLRGFRREDIAEFMNQTYQPTNIKLAVVGNVSPERALELIGRSWSSLKDRYATTDSPPEEPERREFRWHRMNGDIQQRLLAMTFHAPPILHPDAPPLMMLSALLSDGRSSRLHRTLKEEEKLVNSVWTNYEGFLYSGHFTMGAEVIDEDPLPVEVGLFRELDRLIQGAINSDEMERIRTRIMARQFFAQEEVLGMARTLASCEGLGDYRLFDEITNRLMNVGENDIRRCAGKYVDKHRATILEYLPRNGTMPDRTSESVFQAIGEVKGKSESIESSATFTPTAISKVGGGESSSDDTVRMVLDCGAVLLFRPRRDLPITAFQMLFPGGRRCETKETAGTTNLMLKSSMKGSEKYSAKQIANGIESLGSSIGLPMGSDYFGFATKTLSHRFMDAIDIVKDVIRNPLFPAEEVDREKTAIAGEIRRLRDQMPSRAIETFNRVCFADQPYGLPTSGLEDAVNATSPDMLHAWHANHTQGVGTVVSVVGDVDIHQLIDAVSDIVPKGANSIKPIVSTPLPSGTEYVDLTRKQTASVFGFPGAAMNEDGRIQLDLLAEIAGGLAGRFFKAVRGDKGLAYAVSAFNRSRKDCGTFIVYAATAPENEDKARTILLAECARLANELVSDSEIADAKAAIKGRYAISLQTFYAMASELALGEIYGLPLDEQARYLAQIDAVTPNELMESANTCFTSDIMWRGVVRGIEG